MSGDSSRRNCGKCNLCCKLLAIPELTKSDNVWCEHCEIGRGCNIYASRPQVCRSFDCRYIVDPTLSDEWNPAEAHFLLRAYENKLIVQVDPKRPDAWKKKLYHAGLRQHARAVYPRGGQIFIKIGARTIALLPDREVDLGICTEGVRIAITPEFTATGVRWNAARISTT
jgi:hypothetical protein